MCGCVCSHAPTTQLASNMRALGSSIHSSSIDKDNSKQNHTCVAACVRSLVRPSTIIGDELINYRVRRLSSTNPLVLKWARCAQDTETLGHLFPDSFGARVRRLAEADESQLYASRHLTAAMFFSEKCSPRFQGGARKRPSRKRE